MTRTNLADIPLGHLITSHVVLGWCCVCRGRTVDEELSAWQMWSMVHVPEVAEALALNGKRH